jgi:hypothetical protein
VFAQCKFLKVLGHVMVLIVLGIVGFTWYAVVPATYGPLMFSGAAGSRFGSTLLVLFFTWLVSGRVLSAGQMVQGRRLYCHQGPETWIIWVAKARCWAMCCMMIVCVHAWCSCQGMCCLCNKNRGGKQARGAMCPCRPLVSNTVFVRAGDHVDMVILCSMAHRPRGGACGLAPIP